jgi:hypothetical protein
MHQPILQQAPGVCEKVIKNIKISCKLSVSNPSSLVQSPNFVHSGVFLCK